MRTVTENDEWEPIVPLVDDTRVVARRAAQFALDVLLVQVVAVAVAAGVAFAVRALLGGGHVVLSVLVFGLVWLWLSLFGWLLVTVLWPVLRGGRSPAMSWLGLRVVTLEGRAPRPAAHILRCVLTIVDGVPFGLVGLVTMANSARQQRVGDIVAGTLVIRDRSRS
jgi:uncharacterized RDD family membrane protein YckC